MKLIQHAHLLLLILDLKPVSVSETLFGITANVLMSSFTYLEHPNTIPLKLNKEV